MNTTAGAGRVCVRLAARPYSSLVTGFGSREAGGKTVVSGCQPRGTAILCPSMRPVLESAFNSSIW